MVQLRIRKEINYNKKNKKNSKPVSKPVQEIEPETDEYVEHMNISVQVDENELEQESGHSDQEITRHSNLDISHNSNHSELESDHSSEQNDKPKRKRAVYQEICSFSDKIEIDSHIRTNFEYNMNITHNELVNCTITNCTELIEHKMRQIYRICSCNNCDLK